RLRGPSERAVRGALGLGQDRVLSLTPALTWRYRWRAGMSLARPHQAGALLVASLLLVLTAATGVHGACNATCKRDIARCVATQCAGVGRETCRRRCKPAAIRTLAYVVTECREDAAGMVVYHQALRIRRGDREPIPVVEFPPSEPVPDPGGLCRYYGDQRAGNNSAFWVPLQPLRGSPDRAGA